MDIKCHTAQQLQQQQQQQQTAMLMSGNERMLTTSTTTSTTPAPVPLAMPSAMTTPTNAIPIATATATPTTTATSASAITTTMGGCVGVGGGGGSGGGGVADATRATALKANETPMNGKNVLNANNNNNNSNNSNNNSNISNANALTTITTTATTTAAGSSATNVNGSCQSHNHNNHNNHNSNNNNNNNNNSNNNNNNSHNNKPNHSSNQQQMHDDGHGPGPPLNNLTHLIGNGVGLGGGVGGCGGISGIRVALGECNLNGGMICGAGSMIGGCGGVGLNGNASALCMPNANNHAFLMQQQQQQHQQQQHQLHLHLPQHQHPHLHQQQHIPHPNAASLLAANSLSTMANGGSTASMPALPCCGYCCQPICDRYIMRVVDTSFHESCLKCATCTCALVHSCFARDGKLYCRIDYERLFMRNRCLGCGHKIASDELVMRTLENVFHLKCFACVVCGALLKKGEQYVVKQGQLFCRFDYEKEVEMLQGYDFYGDDMFPPKLDGRRGPKRPRTILNTQQRRAFKASFEVSPKPCRKVRENLAKETGLSLRIVQVWFQNQRAKVKKIQKKAKQEHVKGTSDSQDSQESDSSPTTKIKDEAHSDSESLLESPYSSCGAGGGGGGSGSSDGLAKLRCLRDDGDGMPYNCMETNKENCNKTNEPILNTILGLSYATFQQLMGPFTQSPMINPIDRLYSMQNSYFRPDDLASEDTYNNNCHRDTPGN